MLKATLNLLRGIKFRLKRKVLVYSYKYENKDVIFFMSAYEIRKIETDSLLWIVNNLQKEIARRQNIKSTKDIIEEAEKLLIKLKEEEC